MEPSRQLVSRPDFALPTLLPLNTLSLHFLRSSLFLRFIGFGVSRPLSQTETSSAAASSSSSSSSSSSPAVISEAAVSSLLPAPAAAAAAAAAGAAASSASAGGENVSAASINVTIADVTTRIGRIVLDIKEAEDAVGNAFSDLESLDTEVSECQASIAALGPVCSETDVERTKLTSKCQRLEKSHSLLSRKLAFFERKLQPLNNELIELRQTQRVILQGNFASAGSGACFSLIDRELLRYAFSCFLRGAILLFSGDILVLSVCLTQPISLPRRVSNKQSKPVRALNISRLFFAPNHQF